MPPPIDVFCSEAGNFLEFQSSAEAEEVVPGSEVSRPRIGREFLNHKPPKFTGDGWVVGDNANRFDGSEEFSVPQAPLSASPRQHSFISTDFVEDPSTISHGLRPDGALSSIGARGGADQLTPSVHDLVNLLRQDPEDGVNVRSATCLGSDAPLAADLKALQSTLEPAHDFPKRAFSEYFRRRESEGVGSSSSDLEREAHEPKAMCCFGAQSNHWAATRSESP